MTILVNKTMKLCIKGIQLDILNNYFNDRRQSVTVGEFRNSREPINYTVPQGSVLGPTLILIYINSLSQLVITGGRIIPYADDTILVFADKTWENMGFRQGYVMAFAEFADI